MFGKSGPDEIDRQPFGGLPVRHPADDVDFGDSDFGDSIKWAWTALGAVELHTLRSRSCARDHLRLRLGWNRIVIHRNGIELHN